MVHGGRSNSSSAGPGRRGSRSRRHPLEALCGTSRRRCVRGERWRGSGRISRRSVADEGRPVAVPAARSTRFVQPRAGETRLGLHVRDRNGPRARDPLSLDLRLSSRLSRRSVRNGCSVWSDRRAQSGRGERAGNGRLSLVEVGGRRAGLPGELDGLAVDASVGVSGDVEGEGLGAQQPAGVGGGSQPRQGAVELGEHGLQCACARLAARGSLIPLAHVPPFPHRRQNRAQHDGGANRAPRHTPTLRRPATIPKCPDRSNPAAALRTPLLADRHYPGFRLQS